MSRKRKEQKQAVDPFLIVESAKNRASRVRSTRPFIHERAQISIKNLEEWGLLRLGEDSWHQVADDFFVFVSLAGECPFVVFTAGKDAAITIQLESRRLGRGLVWYFVDPSAGNLCKSFAFSKPGENQPPVYASQYQSKAFRQLLQIEKLMLAINGDFYGGVGPARGQSKLRKLDRLQRIYRDPRVTEDARQKVINNRPDFEDTFVRAKRLLKRELAMLQKGWNDFLRKQKSAENSAPIKRDDQLPVQRRRTADKSRQTSRAKMKPQNR